MGEADRFFKNKIGRMMSVCLIVGNLNMTFNYEKRRTNIAFSNPNIKLHSSFFT